MKSKFTLLELWLLCVIANFAYACFDSNWMSALERSYFQSAPLLMVLIARKLHLLHA